ncbi:hypothetical protein M9Y10_031940 [Tritrichomonas musculus]|uniref:Uncharacterized protein n=1 Tax=Tritrichomonas musculus TaxID=1915356 RepID=A0ABR2H0X0_9EUKA
MISIQGKVVDIIKGKVTAVFGFSFGKVPPGCKPGPNEIEEGIGENEEEEYDTENQKNENQGNTNGTQKDDEDDFEEE